MHRERADLQGWESGQDHVALALYNGNEYLEGMLGSYRARVAPFNVNYRNVGEELQYLLNDARPKAFEAGGEGMWTEVMVFTRPAATAKANAVTSNP